MIALEDLVRTTLAEHANDAPDGTGLLAQYLDAGEVQPSRSSRRWAVPLLVAALITALVVGTIVVVKRRTADESRPAAPVAAELWRISFHGIELDVPAAWRRPQSNCFPSSADGIILGEGYPSACPAMRNAPTPPELLIRLTALNQPAGRSAAAGAKTPTELAGVPARYGRQLDAGDAVTETYVLPRPGVVLTEVTTSPAARRRVIPILASIRLNGPIDVNGCSVQFDDSVPPASPAPSDQLFDGTVKVITECAYEGADIVNSSRLVSKAADQLADFILKLPTPSANEPCLSDRSGPHFVLLVTTTTGRTTLTVESTRCWLVGNGHTLRQADDLLPRLQAELGL